MTRTADQPRMATSRRVRRTLAAFAVAALLTAGCTLPAFAPRTEVEGAAAPTGSSPTWRPCPEVPDDLVGRGAPGMRYECT